MDSTIVIKVKYAETVRRFSARVVDGEFDLDMDKLRDKILLFFKFSRDAEFTITYIDEDNDVVTLADDDDLRDVVRQGLNPLRITVNLSTERSSESSSSYRTSGTFPQLGSSWTQQLVQNLSSQDPLFRVLTECIMLMNRFRGHQSDPAAPAHGQSTSETVTGDARGPKINEAGNSGVVVPAGTVNVLSDNQSEKVVLKTDEVKSQSVADCSKLSARSDLQRFASQIRPRTSPQTDIGMNESIKQPPSVDAAPVSKNVPREKKEANQESTTPNEIPSFLPYIPVSLNIQNSQPISTLCDGTNIASVGSLGSSSASPNPNVSPLRGSKIGMPLRNLSAVPVPLPFVAQSRRNHRQGDNPVMMFHRGVRCDGCGVHPITGIRFKSRVKEDYDLCSFCFGEMGNEEDYIRIDRPMTYNKRLFPFRGPLEVPRRSKMDSCFIHDMSISDGTLMAPSTQFTKIWRMKNTGTVVWPQGTQLVWIGGDQLTHLFSVELEIPKGGLPVGNELDIAVDFVAPRHPGQYISYWRMVSPSGHKFGQRVWVLIQVDVNELPPDSFHSFNLNLPPVSNGVSNPETINVNPEPVVKDNLHELGLIEFASSDRTADLVEPVVALPVQKEEQVNLPINDSLFVGGAVSKPSLRTPSSSVTYPIVDRASAPPSTSISYPIVDLLETAAPPPTFPASESVPVTVVQTSSVDLGLKPEVEETLLKDLEEMGFKEVDLNKEILRLNEYDLEKSLNDLCGVSEWDPILEELNEMGFHDEEKNRELLKKNNGSVKRVVMDLLGGDIM